MTLIEQIYEATVTNYLIQPFTTKDLKNWVKKYNISKTNCEKYADASIDAILSNSDIVNKPTSNKNIKVLQSSHNEEGVKEYWFDN